MAAGRLLGGRVSTSIDAVSPAAAEEDLPAPLSLRGVSNELLREVTFEVAPGEIVGLSGPSGSGKSRLLRAIADLDEHRGEIRLGTRAQHELQAHDWRARVMLVPAESQWWADTVGEHFPAGDVPGLAELGFDRAVAGWQVSRLSSGEKQRLGLLRALAYRPRALLLDEPTANLDPQSAAKVERMLSEAARGRGLPVIWVSHDSDQLARVATRCFRIEAGLLARSACS